MEQETSYGIVPFCRIDGQWHLLVVQHVAGHWAFPKGRAEPNEAAYDCAVRELHEETGLSVQRLLSSRAFTEHYSLVRNGISKSKQVTYFPAEVVGYPTPQPGELVDCQWLPLSQVRNRLTFSEAKMLVDAVFADEEIKKSLA